MQNTWNIIGMPQIKSLSMSCQAYQYLNTSKITSSNITGDKTVDIKSQGRHMQYKIYLSEIHLKLKSRETSFIHNICFSYPIILKFFTEHGSDTAMLCAKFQNVWVLVIEK